VTFALREALWALSDIASEMDLMPEGSLKDAVLEAMRHEPRHWNAYYLDPEHEQFDLQFSLSDRIRYYWAMPEVARACARLLDVLAAEGVPLTLLSQYLPRKFAAIRDGELRNEPRELVLDSVAHVLRQYAEACHPTAAARRAVND
jgi:D-tagatose-1,6-bisphosphate aldolase subunit GatZ/KbaZ